MSGLQDKSLDHPICYTSELSELIYVCKKINQKTNPNQNAVKENKHLFMEQKLCCGKQLHNVRPHFCPVVKAVKNMLALPSAESHDILN